MTAGAALVREFTSWDWDGLTFRAVAERADVSERTVYRHFPTERQLHDAVMARLEDEAGITYDDVELGTIAEVTGRLIASLQRFSVEQTVRTPQSPAFLGADERRRTALLHAVQAEAPDLTDVQQRIAAGLLDTVWNPATYERLASAWGLDDDVAFGAIEWMISGVVSAVRSGDIAAAEPSVTKGRAKRRAAGP